jgi:kynurenine formamidase
MKIVDLSHEVRNGMQVYPGDPEVVIESALNVDEHGVNVLSLHLGSQSGTHLDSPFHVLSELATLDQLDLTRFVGRACVVDATGLEPRSEIPHKQFTSVTYEDCSIVLLRTDWSDYFGTEHYLAHPYPALESLRYLLGLGITTIALDFLSLDRTSENPKDATLENHYLWSKENGIIAENLTNLRNVNEETPFVSLLPIKLGASDGAWIRAIALSGLE